MSLNRKYFTTLSTKTVECDKYHIIRPIGNPMILFSNIDGTPLAALHLRCQKGYPGNALVSKRHSGETDFRGLIGKMIRKSN